MLSSITFTLRRETLTVVTGESGSMKTTILLALAGLPKSRGSLRLRGQAGLVFQKPGLRLLSSDIFGGGAFVPGPETKTEGFTG